jgi:protein TIF31
MDHSSAPMDGQILSENLHTRGINIRYLGKIAEKLSKIKQLEYLYSITVAELITRAAKHIFNTYIQVRRIIYYHCFIYFKFKLFIFSQPS